MSRYSINEPDLDRFNDRDPDVQDFPKDGEPWGFAVDPAEHAAHSVIEAASTFERELATTEEFDRLMAVRRMVHRAVARLLKVSDLAAGRCDEIVERRR